MSTRLEKTSEERYNLGRYVRRLERCYRVFHKRTQGNEASSCLKSFFHLDQDRYRVRGQVGSFASPTRRRFYCEMERFFPGSGSTFAC